MADADDIDSAVNQCLIGDRTIPVVEGDSRNFVEDDEVLEIFLDKLAFIGQDDSLQVFAWHL